MTPDEMKIIDRLKHNRLSLTDKKQSKYKSIWGVIQPRATMEERMYQGKNVTKQIGNTQRTEEWN